jgi:hypothetical protein
MTEQEFSSIALPVCISGLILYMMFIIYKLSKESEAGKWGTFALFLALGVGMFGFIAKTVIVEVMGL